MKKKILCLLLERLFEIPRPNYDKMSLGVHFSKRGKYIQKHFLVLLHGQPAYVTDDEFAG